MYNNIGQDSLKNRQYWTRYQSCFISRVQENLVLKIEYKRINRF